MATRTDAIDPLTPLPAELRNHGLPIAIKRRDVRPLDRRVKPQTGDILFIVMVTDRVDEVSQWLMERSWSRLDSKPVERA